MKLTLTPGEATHADADTLRFQQAIDEIAACGGGTLTIGAGRYYLGGLRLYSHLTLWLETGAELIASDQPAHYQQAQTLSEAECSRRVFLYALGGRHITIGGPGTINGNADGWFSSELDDMGYRASLPERPRIIVLEDCNEVRLQDFTLVNAPMWTIHLVSCQGAYLSGLNVSNSLTMANTDALDIDSCENVHITHCHFSAADDAICLKTTRKPKAIQRPCRGVVISNCTLRSKSCALKIGTETFADIENIIVSNCAIYDSNRGIGLISRDGGQLRRMVFSNLTVDCTAAPACHWGKADPLFLSVRHRDPAVTPGNIWHIQFRGLSGLCEGAINLHSEVPGAIHDIVLDGVQLEQQRSAGVDQGFYDIRPPCNPSRPTGMGLDNAWCLNPDTGRAWGVEPFPGGLPVIFARGVSGLRLSGLTFRRPQPLPAEWNGDAIVLVDCEQVQRAE